MALLLLLLAWGESAIEKDERDKGREEAKVELKVEHNDDEDEDAGGVEGELPEVCIILARRASGMMWREMDRAAGLLLTLSSLISSKSERRRKRPEDGDVGERESITWRVERSVWATEEGKVGE